MYDRSLLALVALVALAGCAGPDAATTPLELPPNLAEILAEADSHVSFVRGPPVDGVEEAWQIRTPGIRTWFIDDRVVLRPRRDDGSWRVDMRFDGWGRVGHRQPAPLRETVTVGNRIDLVRDGLVEWYVDLDEGLEQGFTLAEPPAGSGHVELALTLEGDLLARSASDAVMMKVAGQDRVRYGELAVLDATGAELPSEMRLDGCEDPVDACRILLRFDDAGASWPVTVDPLLTTLETTDITGLGGDGFTGYSVAIDGDRALVGIPGLNAAGTGGTAVVLRRNDGPLTSRWAFEDTLEPTLASGYGTAVAFDYPYAVVTAPISGKADIYEHTAAGWTEVRAFVVDTNVLPSFGHTAAISQDIALIAAPSGGANGSVGVYLRLLIDAGGGWALHSTLLPSGYAADADARFGEALAIDGTLFAVGAPTEGDVFIYDRGDIVAGTNTIELQAELSSGTPGYGATVAVSQGRVLVGGPGLAPELYSQDDTGGDWLLRQTLELPPLIGEGFGERVALDVDRAYISDTFASDGTSRLHVYDTDDSGDLVFSETLTVGPEALTYGPALAAADGALIVGLPEDGAEGAVRIYRAEGDAFVEAASSGSATIVNEGSRLGLSVAIDGDYIAVGAPDSDKYWFAGGAVMVLQRDPASGTWAYDHELAPPFAALDDGNYGQDVVMDANRLLVGADTVDDVLTNRGAAYLYERDGGPYLLKHTFADPSGVGFANFGGGIAIQNDFVVIGAPGVDTTYVYERHTGNVATDSWGQVGIIEPGILARFGNKVAIDGTTIAIGARSDDTFALDGGAVHIYKQGPLFPFPYTLEATLLGGTEGAFLGSELVLADGRLAAGAPGHAGGAGAVYLFEVDGNVWTQVAMLTHPTDPVALNGVGNAVALSGETLYVGAPFSEEVLVFAQNEGGADKWGHRSSLFSNLTSSAFGVSLASAGSTLVVGAPRFDDVHTDEGTVFVFRLDANLPPVAIDDAVNLAEDTKDSIYRTELTANDYDTNGDSLMVTIVDVPTHGTLTTGIALEYVPDLDYHGPDSFTYTVSDGQISSAPATVHIEVTSVNDLCQPNPDLGFVAVEDVLYASAWSVLDNDIDPDFATDPEELTALESLATAHGTLTLNADGTFTYLGDPDYSGDDLFTYDCVDKDGLASSAPATVAISVTAVDDPPTAQDWPDYETDEDTTLEVAPPGVLGGAVDADGDTLSAQLLAQAANGFATVRPNGSFEYVPDPGFEGLDSFTFEVSDGTNTSGAATVSVEVRAVNDLPVTVPDAYAVREDGVLTVSTDRGLLANDSDEEGDALTAIIVAQPLSGTITQFFVGGGFTYQPDPDFYGEDGFSYQVLDGPGQSAVTSVLITVTPINDPPFASDDTYTWDPELGLDVGPLEGVLTNDGDADGELVTVFAVVKDVTYGELVLETDGSFVYEPEPGFEGKDTFTYTATDGDSTTLPALVEIEVEDNPGEGGVDPGSEDPATCETLTYLIDRDGDGFGDDEMTVEACGPTDGLVEIGGDCDDTTATVYPGATEVAQDGVDQDCSGVDAVVEPVGACATGALPSSLLLVLLAPLVIRRKEDR